MIGRKSSINTIVCVLLPQGSSRTGGLGPTVSYIGTREHCSFIGFRVGLSLGRQKLTLASGSRILLSCYVPRTRFKHDAEKGMTPALYGSMHAYSLEQAVLTTRQ